MAETATTTKKLSWDGVGERFYETGVSKGVLYPFATETANYPKGVAWNGLISVSESPSGAEATPLYADDTKYLNLISKEEFSATIEAYTYPEEFKACNGEADLVDGVSIGQQSRQTFGMSYKTVIGNDTEGNAKGYKIHLIYGCLATPSEKTYTTVNDSPEAITFSWEINTTPVNVEGHQQTSIVTIDSTKLSAAQLKAVEDALYGTDSADPYLPTPDEIKALINGAAA